MSTAAETAAAPVLTPAVVSDPVFVQTDSGAVAVYGHEHVSKKDLIILNHCLTLPEFSKEMGVGFSNHNVKSVIFRTDNRPKNKEGKPILANCAFDAGAICVNLLQTVTAGIEDAMKHGEVSIFASYHRNMILSFLHEIHHLATLEDVPTDPDLVDMAEDDAEIWSMDSLIELAKTKDIEPAHHAESSFLSNQLMELLKENTDEWAIEQRRMLDNHIMYLLPETETKKEVPFHSFKGYVQLLAGDVDDPAWKKETILGAGAVNPYDAAIRAISDPIPEVKTPTSAMPNTSPVVLAEHMEIEDPGYEGMAIDPNMMGFGFGAPVNNMFPMGEMPAIPMSVAGLNANPTPAFNDFPVANMNPAPTPTAPMTAPGQVPVFPVTGRTNEQIAEIVKGVYMKCYQHIFTHCGRLMNSDHGFSNPKAVYRMALPRTQQEIEAGMPERFRPFGIALTPEEMAVVVKVECSDINERWCPNMPTSGGVLYGHVMKNTLLPHYKLTINMSGMEVVRLLLPQNPATRDSNGQYKKTAMAARNGSAIMYIMEGNDSVVASGGKKYLFKIVDNQLLAC